MIHDDHDDRLTVASAERKRERWSRRAVLKAAGSGTVALATGSASVGSGSGGVGGFEDLSVGPDNRIVTDTDEAFVPRGLNVPDPKRVAVTKRLRGKTAIQILDRITSEVDGWHPNVVRVPAQPIDIGEHPNGNTGPRYGEDSPEEVPDDRPKRRPPQPPAFDREDLESYVENYYDPVVQRCKERGVYCIVDFHRHWHEQPPGDGEGNGGPEGQAGAENHLPYDSPYTNYWAKNTYWGDGESIPASWGYVDQRFRNGYDGDYVPEDETDHPYHPEHWTVNESLVAEAVAFWDYVADYYADEPHVIFEPYNEPTAPGIWGPVEGCGAWKQHGLWRTYLEDFAAPILDTVRQHAPETLVAMGLPGWSQGTQGLHWDDFGAVDHGDVAVTWHNYGDHEVSQVQNWRNDTDYEYLEVEDPRGTESDPGLDTVQCYGWEYYEAQGLQEATEYHPVLVTEFGWMDDPEPTGWGIPDAWEPTTRDYGEPLLDALEADDRIGWVAWCADVRWMPAMFEVGFDVPGGEVDLANGSWYQPDTAVPTACDDLPCDWTLLADPQSGEYVKQRLADENATDAAAPSTTATSTSNTTTTATAGRRTATPEPVGTNGAVPSDPDADGLYEDVNGNGRRDVADAVDVFRRRQEVDPRFFDFNDSGSMDIGDAVALFRENAD